MQNVEMKAAASSDGDPLDQIRDALNGIRVQLREASARPSDLTSMTWIAQRPARFHCSQPGVDLAYREVLGGNRPPIRLRPGDGPLQVLASAKLHSLDDSKPVWRDYTLAQLAQQMTPRNRKTMPDIFLKWRAHSQAFRKAHNDAIYDLSYGPSNKEALDIFYPEGAHGPLPVWVFFHGGAHQASDKSDISHYATPLLKAGFAVVMPNYGLCPEVPLQKIVEHTSRCIRFVLDEADALEFDRDQVHIAGTSAGAHLVAMAATDPELAFVRSCLSISAIFDLRPKAMLQGRTLGITTPDACEGLSPSFKRPNAGTRIGVVVGGEESDEFRRQSTELAKSWGGAFLEVAGKDHFDIKDELIHGGPLQDFALALVAKDARSKLEEVV
jgi:arylformamidase